MIVGDCRVTKGVVRKTVADDLVEDIWAAVHMDKIVPSLLYNMQMSTERTMSACGNTPEVHEQSESDALIQTTDPAAMAENCLRELVGRASFHNIRSVITPVFKYFFNLIIFQLT